MPIKFRCTHCHQLLGISRTRATARVDCPRCGRSIRVPQTDGNADSADTGSEDRHSDGALQKALGELSVLAAPESNAPNPSGDTSVKTPPPLSRGHSAIALEPLPAEDPIVIELQPQSVTQDPPAVEFQEPDSRTSDPLAELARTGRDGLKTSETAPDENSSRRFSLALSLMLFTGALVVGWMLGASQNRSLQTIADHEPNSIIEDQNPKVGQVGVANVLNGRIEYQDTDGQMLADGGALVLLFPNPRLGSLLLDARSFQKKPDHPDRMATEAALKSLGGQTARCDSDGRFSILPATTGSHVLIAVSQHLERPDDVATDAASRAVISAWFNSSDHIIGRRRVEMSRIDDTAGSESLDIQFLTQL